MNIVEVRPPSIIGIAAGTGKTDEGALIFSHNDVLPRLGSPEPFAPDADSL